MDEKDDEKQMDENEMGGGFFRGKGRGQEPEGNVKRKKMIRTRADDNEDEWKKRRTITRRS